MFLFRLILVFALGYLIIRLLRNIMQPSQKQTQGKISENGRPPYDARNIEDIDFRDIPPKN